MVADKYKDFLLGPAKTATVGHSSRNLYLHLCGTHDLLESWGNPEPVCLAGLFHSIYGTKSFRHKSWPLDDRKTIRELIGEEAERLAYVFCTADRGLFYSAADGFLTRDLREIEAANLIEQGSKSGRLKKLYDSNISVPAKRDLKRYLEISNEA